MKFTFTNKETYLAYRSEWKAQYKQLSQDIRDLKFCRAFPQAKRFENPKNVERYREIEKRLFNNANTCVEWKLEQYRNKATAMLEELKEAKVEAQHQYLVAHGKDMVTA
jgi:hypothetical protein